MLCRAFVGSEGGGFHRSFQEGLELHPPLDAAHPVVADSDLAVHQLDGQLRLPRLPQSVDEDGAHPPGHLPPPVHDAIRQLAGLLHPPGAAQHADHVLMGRLRDDAQGGQLVQQPARARHLPGEAEAPGEDSEGGRRGGDGPVEHGVPQLERLLVPAILEQPFEQDGVRVDRLVAALALHPPQEPEGLVHPPGSAQRVHERVVAERVRDQPVHLRHFVEQLHGGLGHAGLAEPVDHAGVEDGVDGHAAIFTAPEPRRRLLRPAGLAEAVDHHAVGHLVGLQALLFHPLQEFHRPPLVAGLGEGVH